MEKPAPADHPIHPLLAARWSSRAIDPDQPVTQAELLTLLEAGRWAPSSGNEQPWRYLVFTSSDPEALEAARACLTPGNYWARAAPILLLSIAREHFTQTGKPNRHAQHDVGLASENLVLQAAALGLVAHQMAGFDVQQAKERFRIPDGFQPMAMIAIGRPGSPAHLSEKHQQAERTPRHRRPLREIALEGSWERPFEKGLP